MAVSESFEQIIAETASPKVVSESSSGIEVTCHLLWQSLHAQALRGAQRHSLRLRRKMHAICEALQGWQERCHLGQRHVLGRCECERATTMRNSVAHDQNTDDAELSELPPVALSHSARCVLGGVSPQDPSWARTPL